VNVTEEEMGTFRFAHTDSSSNHPSLISGLKDIEQVSGADVCIATCNIQKEQAGINFDSPALHLNTV
jgi:hypothetical protein